MLAESDNTVVVEGNHYFPAESVGTLGYYDVVVNGDVNPAAAWYYADRKPAAAEIEDRVAFWRVVQVEP